MVEGQDPVFPSKEELEATKASIAGKINSTTAQKNADVLDKVSGIYQIRRDSIELNEYSKTADENLQYYAGLDENGLLPEDEQGRLTEAQELAGRVEGEINEGNRLVENAMANPDIVAPIQEQANTMNKEVKRKEKVDKHKVEFLQWTSKIADLIAEAHKLSEAIESEDISMKNASYYLMDVIKNVEFVDGGSYDRLIEAAKKDSETDGFGKQIEKEESEVGFFKFKLKEAIKSVSNSPAYENYKKAKGNHNEFLEKNGLKGVTLKYNGEYGAIDFLLKNRPELVEEFKGIGAVAEGEKQDILSYEYEKDVLREIKDPLLKKQIEWIMEDSGKQ